MEKELEKTFNHNLLFELHKEDALESCQKFKNRLHLNDAFGNELYRDIVNYQIAKYGIGIYKSKSFCNSNNKHIMSQKTRFKHNQKCINKQKSERFIKRAEKDRDFETIGVDM